MGKGENAGNLHLLLSPQCISTSSKTSWILALMNLSSANSLDLVKANILSFCKELTLCLTITTFNKPHKKEPFENFVEKGENAGNQHFLLFPQCFSTLPKPNLNFSFTFIMSSANVFYLEQSKILSFGEE